MVSQVVQTSTAQFFDLPLIGDDLAKVGRIIDLYAEPCSPTAELWVYGFFQAIPTLFITLTKPELIDINIRKGAHRRRKGRRLKFRADALFRDAIFQIPVPRWVVFRIYEWTQRIGWYFLVADALEDFGINWMSLAYKYNGCQGILPPYITFDQSKTLQTIDNGPWPISIAAESLNQMVVSSVYFGPQFPGTYRCSWSALWEPYPPEPGALVPYSTVLQEWNGVGWDNHTPGEGSALSGGRNLSTGDITMNLFGGERFRLASLATNAGHAYVTPTLEMSALKVDAIAPDP